MRVVVPQWEEMGRGIATLELAEKHSRKAGGPTN
jgi:hypothetical protein